MHRILDILSQRTGTDFSNYKSATIRRRLDKRLKKLGIESIEDYIKLLETDRNEAEEMFQVILIGVTRFFRDTEAFVTLEKYLKELIRSKKSGDELRIWVPACSTGEEAYSIAIAVHRFLKEAGKKDIHVQIFATDIDRRALEHARRGFYSESTLELLSDDTRDTYFIKKGKKYELLEEVRSMVLFSKHDITQNPPFLRLDLISCRNLFIYFNSALQKQLLSVFHFALKDPGYLFLGKSESIGSLGDLFDIADAEHKIFKRIQGNENKQVLKFSGFKRRKQHFAGVSRDAGKEEVLQYKIREKLFNLFDFPYAVVSRSADIREIHGDVRLYMTLPEGSLKVNLLKMINPELNIEFRSLFTNAKKTKQAGKGKLKRFKLFGKEHFVRLRVVPIEKEQSGEELYLVVFEQPDVNDLFEKGGFTKGKPNKSKLSNARIAELEDELTSTREHLQAQIEQLEVANEELQSLNEELESSNEEFNSTNEELEATNEELQSSYQEMNAAYAQLENTHLELEKSQSKMKEQGANMKALLNNKLQAMALLDKQGKLLSYNERAALFFRKFGNEEIPRDARFFDLVSQDVWAQFKSGFNRSLEGDAVSEEIRVADKNNKEFWYVLNCTPVFVDKGQVTGISVAIMDISELKSALTGLSEKDRLVQSVFEAAEVGLCVTDEDSRFVDVNRKYCEIYGFTKSELTGKSISVLAPEGMGEKYIEINQEYLRGVNTDTVNEFVVLRKDGAEIVIEAAQRKFIKSDGARYLVTSVRDVTQEREIQNREFQAKELLQRSERISNTGSWEMDVKTGEVHFSEQFARMLHVKNSTFDQGLDVILEYTHPEDREKAAGEYQKAVKKRTSVQFEKRITDGKNRVKDVLVSCVYDAPNKHSNPKLFTTVKDLSEINKAMKALGESKLRIRSLLQSVNGIVWEVDPDTQEFLFVSDQVKDILGYSKEEWLSESNFWRNHIHPEDRKAAVEYCMSEIKAGRDHRFEYRMENKSGDYIWIHDRATVLKQPDGKTSVRGIMLDITDQKVNEEELKLLSSVVTNTNDCVVVTSADSIDEPEPKITYVNEAMLRLTGYKREEVIGKSPRMFQGDATRRSELDKIRKALEKRESVETQVINYSKKGDPYWVEIGIAPVFDDAGSCTHFIAVQRDITKIKVSDLRDKLVAEISNIFNLHDSLPELLEKVLHQLVPYGEFNVAEAWLKDSYGKRMVLTSKCSEGKKEHGFHKSTDEHLFVEYGKGLPGVVWERGEFVYWNDIQSNKKAIRGEIAKKSGITSAAGIPLIHAGELVGVLMLAWEQQKDERELHLTLPLQIGDHLGTEIKRKQAEKELAQVFDTSKDIICVIDSSGYFRKLNPAAEDILGYSREILQEKPLYEFLSSEDEELTKDYIREVIESGKTGFFENRFICKEEEIKYLEWTLSPDETGSFIFGIGRNVTGKRKLEKLLDRATDLAKIGGWERNFINRTLHWSANTKEIHEVDPDFEPDFDTPMGFLSDEKSRKQVKKLIKNAEKTGKGWDVELQIITAKGNKRWVRSIGEPEVVNGKCVKIIGSVQDIESYKSVELELKRRTDYMAAVSQLNGFLLHYNDWKAAFEESLPAIAEAVKADSVYYFDVTSEGDEPVVGQTLVWNGENGTDDIDDEDLQNIPVSEYSDFFEPIMKGKVMKFIVSELKPGKTKEGLEHKGVKSMMGLPVSIKGEFKGFIGFEDRTNEREWSSDDEAFLKTVTNGLSTAMENAESDKLLEEAYKEKHTILESITDAFYSVDKDWKFTYFNKEAEHLLDKKSKDVLGKYIWDVFSKAAESDLKENYEQAMNTGQSAFFEYRYEPENRWFEVNAYPSDNGLSVYFKDVTERRDAFMKVKESNERFERVAEATNEAIWDWNIEENTFYKGEGFKKLFGQEAGIIPCDISTASRSTHPQDQKRVQESVIKALDDPETSNWKQEYRFKKSNGQYAYVIDKGFIIRDSAGKPVRMVGAVEDITERKEYEKTLKKLNNELKSQARDLSESQRRYSDLFHLSPQPMWVYDVETLKFLDVNEAALRQYGYSKEAFLEMTIDEIRPREYRSEIREIARSKRLYEPGTSVGIHKHKKANGELIEADIRISELPFKGKKARLTLAIDVTERLQYIEAIKKQNKKLKEIAWTQSHVVRAPLARIMGLVEMLDELEQSGMNREELLNHIIESGKELDQVIREITDKAQNIDTGEISKSDSRE